MKYSLLWTDLVLYVYLLILVFFFISIARDRFKRRKWSLIMGTPARIVSLCIVLVYLFVAILDSIHVSYQYDSSVDGSVDYAKSVVSVLDMAYKNHSEHSEYSYAEPFSDTTFVPEMIEDDAQGYKWKKRILKYTKLQDDIGKNIMTNIAISFFVAAFVFVSIIMLKNLLKFRAPFQKLAIIISVTIFLPCLLYLVSLDYHMFGTDKVGKDVLYLSLKGVRTGLLIGILTTFFMLPLAICFGVAAGFFRGKVDDFIQYIYTTVSSIPGVLLIAASVLSMQLWLDKNQDLFAGYANRVELRLVMLCFILGVTSWPGLCRLLRAEVMKIRELSYISAAKLLNASSLSIIIKHVLPNVMYLIIISTVMDMSGLVLAESVLSYIGIGVDPSSFSWGNMINSSRMELSREPVIWWGLAGAFAAMFVFVVAINIIADGIRDIYDPKSTTRVL